MRATQVDTDRRGRKETKEVNSKKWRQWVKTEARKLFERHPDWQGVVAKRLTRLIEGCFSAENTEVLFDFCHNGNSNDKSPINPFYTSGILDCVSFKHREELRLLLKQAEECGVGEYCLEQLLQEARERLIR